MSKEEILAKDKYGFEDLVEIMTILRSDDGCPWDREQTHESLRKNMIEEAYEVVEAIDEKSYEHICEELGDVLLQVVFHAKMAQENGEFDINDVTDRICRKMIYRHPHIFSDSKKGNSSEVLEVWEELKRKEKGRLTLADNLDSVCKALPALQKCEKLIKKSRQFGQLTSDSRLMSEALTGNEKEIAEDLSAVCMRAQTLGVDAEEVLDKLCNEYVDEIKASENKGDN